MDNSFLLFVMAFVVVVGGAIMLYIISSRGVRTKLNVDDYEMHYSAAKQQVSDGNAGRQLAVVNVDKLLDKAMRELGFKGQTMGERLKNNRARFSDIDGIWIAHKLRNRIAHESGVSVSEREASSALEQLRRGLRDLGALR